MAKYKKFVPSKSDEARYTVAGIKRTFEYFQDILKEWPDMSVAQREEEIASHKDCLDDYAADVRKLLVLQGDAEKAIVAAKAALAEAKSISKVVKKALPLIAKGRAELKVLRTRVDEPTTWVEKPRRKTRKVTRVAIMDDNVEAALHG